MKTLIAVLFALSMAACATTQAKNVDGRSYTCIPNSALDRGPTQPVPASGEKLTVK